SFYNERQKVKFSLSKVLEQDEKFQIGMNGEITTVTFGLFAAEELTAADGTVIPADGLLEIIAVNENGTAQFTTDLPFGSYYVKELSTDSHYILSDAKYPIVFEYAGQDTALVEIKANDGETIDNELIRGEIHGLKKDEDGKGLGGAVMGLLKADATELTTENAILTATSEDDGSFSFANVPYGNYVVREIEAPTGFILSDTSFPVAIDKDGDIVEVEIENTRIRGTVQLIKTDADYPDNHLSGAVFEVYSDINGDKKFDKDDTLLGTMAELSGGIYQMSDLLFGGYFVKEKTAPAGFILDENAYYFAITENGKTVTVENEAGKGFINDAQKGSLKIVKTSSDNKVEGFSFRVTGANGYNQTFKTDKNGEIVIENLRIGDYTVSEVNDSTSSGYVLPADKQATVKVSATTVVQMHNELRDTPKTGDDSNPALWLVLMGIAGAGAATLGVLGFKKKRRMRNNGR
ncbi:MAG: SpaA isopeptide-forming pilin-related protein, partial [Clostridia bacterium]